nr:hypothetical protein [Lactiplantibacillus plantarum]
MALMILYTQWVSLFATTTLHFSSVLAHWLLSLLQHWVNHRRYCDFLVVTSWGGRNQIVVGNEWRLTVGVSGYLL